MFLLLITSNSLLIYVPRRFHLPFVVWERRCYFLWRSLTMLSIQLFDQVKQHENHKIVI